MKKLLVLIMSLVLMKVAYADDFAKLRIHISGASSDNRYFLCVGTTGCVSIAAGNKGQVYPIDSGKIEDMYTSDISTLRMYTQSLPASCKVVIKDNQTITVTGRLTKSANNKIYIEDINCRVG